MKKVILILIVSFAFLSAKTQVRDTVLTGQTVIASLGDTISVVDAITRNTVVTSKSGVSVVDEVFYVPSTAPNDTIYTLMAARTSGKMAAILLERGSEKDTAIIVSSDSLVFAAYGTGSKPVLSGYINPFEYSVTVRDLAITDTMTALFIQEETFYMITEEGEIMVEEF